MQVETLTEMLGRFCACGEALPWVRSVAHLSPREQWEACTRGDWLLWLAAKAGVDRRLVVRTACACARAALRYVPAGEERPRQAIEATDAWSRGEVGIEGVRAAASAAYADAYGANCARSRSLAQSARLVREIIPVGAMLDAMDGVTQEGGGGGG